MQKNGYHFIYESLLSRIECHALAPGMQLPSEKDLVNEFGASRMTVRRALTRLEEDGRIFRRSGVGSFVKVPGTSESSGARRVEIGVEVHPEWGALRSFMTEVLSASQKACAECNCNLLLRSKEELLAGENVDAAFFLFLFCVRFFQRSPSRSAAPRSFPVVSAAVFCPLLFRAGKRFGPAAVIRERLSVFRPVGNPSGPECHGAGAPAFNSRNSTYK